MSENAPEKTLNGNVVFFGFVRQITDSAYKISYIHWVGKFFNTVYMNAFSTYIGFLKGFSKCIFVI